MGLMGNGEGNTVLILLSKESLLLRESLEEICRGPDSAAAQAADACLTIFNRGVQRGAAKIAEEFAAMQRAKKAGAK